MSEDSDPLRQEVTPHDEGEDEDNNMNDNNIDDININVTTTDDNGDNNGLEHVETAQIEQVDSIAFKNDSDHDNGNCFYLSLAAVVLVVGIVIIVIMLVVVKDDDDDGDDSNNSNNPIEMPPTPAPTPLTLVPDAQERLNRIREAVGNNPATVQYVQGGTIIPNDAALLQDIFLTDTTIDPVTRAAAWSVHTDPFPAERELMERFALAAIYYGTNGDDWIVSDGWLGDSSICSGLWQGLRCCGDFHVALEPHQCIDKERHHLVELDLAQNNLQGPIPPALALLEHLHVLWLEENELTGPLDSTIFGNMASLDALYVQNNRLSGEIDEDIRDNGRLDTLFAHQNDFTGEWPQVFCLECKVKGFCDHDPIAYTLDCDDIVCEVPCCRAERVRQHCYIEHDDDDDEDDTGNVRRQ
mmetsp:Transcript_28312/g.77725  ORF Transcript_28312/g.77725 Transcript_28312/m.77725 type:complete len:412 (+) Transcript_28312:115-1350(+)